MPTPSNHHDPHSRGNGRGQGSGARAGQQASLRHRRHHAIERPGGPPTHSPARPHVRVSMAGAINQSPVGVYRLRACCR